MHYFGNPRHSQPMVAYMILTEYFGKFLCEMVCGYVVSQWCILVYESADVMGRENFLKQGLKQDILGHTE